MNDLLVDVDKLYVCCYVDSPHNNIHTNHAAFFCQGISKFFFPKFNDYCIGTEVFNRVLFALKGQDIIAQGVALGYNT